MDGLPLRTAYPQQPDDAEIAALVLDLRYRQVMRDEDIKYLANLIEDLAAERDRLRQELKEAQILSGI